jgi:hypothetical protein
MRLLCALLCLLAGPALAGPAYMWGVGPKGGVRFGAGPVVGQVGGEGVVYLNRTLRIGGGAIFGLGSDEVQVTALARVETVAAIGIAAFTLGGGLGVGRLWGPAVEGPPLAVTVVPVRLNAGLLVHEGAREWHLRGYVAGRLPLPTSRSPAFQRVVAGLEIAILFGDFTPPRKPSSLDGVPLQVDDHPVD